MANVLYNQARVAFGTALIDLLSHDIRVLLVDTGAYTPNFNTDTFVSDIPGAAIIARSDPLAGKTFALGVFDASDITVPAVFGTSVEVLVLYRDTGVDATSRLILYLDTGTGLPVTPAGDIDIVWSASGIFRL